MPDFNVRSDSVNVEQIMEQIRARIREKRGADYTEQQLQDLANVKLEKFLDPRGVRSDLLDQFRRAQPPYSPPELPTYAFEEETLFESHRGALRLMRRLLQPALKLFFNPNPLIQALNIQARLNTLHAQRAAKDEAARHTFDSLHYEVLHNLVLETTRLGIEVKNLKMRVESLTSRLEFNERRARALEGVVVYKPAPEERAAVATREVRESREPRGGREPRDARAQREPHEAREPRESSVPRDAPEARVVPQPETQKEEALPAPETVAAPNAAPAPEGPGQRSRRRRRRRGRRGGGSAAALLGGPQAGSGQTELDQDRGAAAGPDDGDEPGGSEEQGQATDAPNRGVSDSSDQEP